MTEVKIGVPQFAQAIARHGGPNRVLERLEDRGVLMDALRITSVAYAEKVKPTLKERSKDKAFREGFIHGFTIGVFVVDAENKPGVTHCSVCGQEVGPRDPAQAKEDTEAAVEVAKVYAERMGLNTEGMKVDSFSICPSCSRMVNRVLVELRKDK